MKPTKPTRKSRKSRTFKLADRLPHAMKRSFFKRPDRLLELAPKFGIDLDKPGDLRFNRFTQQKEHRATSFGWQGPVPYKFGNHVYPAQPVSEQVRDIYLSCCTLLEHPPCPKDRLGVCCTAYVGKLGQGVEKNQGLSYHKDDEPIHAAEPVLMVTAAVGPGQLERSLTIRTDSEIQHVRLESGSVFLADLVELEHGVVFKRENKGQKWVTLTFRVLK